MTDPDWEPVMKRAAAIVTDRGGRTCHAAIVSRELGMPCVVGTEHGDGQPRRRRGGHGVVRRGRDGRRLPGRARLHAPQRRSRRTARAARPQVMLNVGNPDQAFRLAALPNDGVGLARIEFIIANAIRVASDGAPPPGARDGPARSAPRSTR